MECRDPVGMYILDIKTIFPFISPPGVNELKLPETALKEKIIIMGVWVGRPDFRSKVSQYKGGSILE